MIIKMADAREMIFSETDGSCAYCGIKDYRVLATHHIIQQDPKDETVGCVNACITHRINETPVSNEDFGRKKGATRR
jgi:hypothetical protein